MEGVLSGLFGLFWGNLFLWEGVLKLGNVKILLLTRSATMKKMMIIMVYW